MSNAQKIAFKNKLKRAGELVIEQRIAAAKALIDRAQEAANSEEKSSVGDKYETARAMGHLEEEMHSQQLTQQVKELAVLHAVKTETIYTTAVTGACIDCGDVLFFIAAGLGKQTVDGKLVLFLSPQAPLAHILQNKKAGDHFLFNGAQRLIHEIY